MVLTYDLVLEVFGINLNLFATQAIGKEGAAETEQPTRILSLEEKQRILKERRLAKRKNKEAAAADPPPAE